MKSKAMLRAIPLCALFAALSAVGAFIKVPLPVVGFTMQNLFVLLSGLLLGPVYGPLSQIVYIGMGLVGLPVFTGGGGPSYVLHPTFGYLLGMILASWLTGRAARRMDSPSFRPLLLACLAGTGAIYLLGLPWMWAVCNLYLGQGLGFWEAAMTGMVLFLPGDLCKAVAAAALAVRIIPAVRGRLKLE